MIFRLFCSYNVFVVTPDSVLCICLLLRAAPSMATLLYAEHDSSSLTYLPSNRLIDSSTVYTDESVISFQKKLILNEMIGKEAGILA